jgi:Histidine phosphatase superfamily (branch 1)
MAIQRVFLVRHGETKWSVSGQHTGMTDIPLTENGRGMPRRLAPILAKVMFARILTSPLQRARETCALAGLGERAETEDGLVEWNYGDYEGLTPREIEAKAPGWMLFTDGCPGGEGPEDVSPRRLGDRARAGGGRACCAFCPRPRLQGLRSAMDRPSCRGRASLPSRHRDGERPQLLPRRPRDKAVERPGRCGRI